jgi:hypothetical protein
MEHALPYLQCACDFHYEVQGNSRMHYIDTHSCERKIAWYHKRWIEVAREYDNRGLSPKAIILDIFDRVVNKGEFLGQTQGDWIFVQNIAEVFLLLNPKVWGDEEYPLQKDSALFKRQCVRGIEIANQVNKNKPPKDHWHPEGPTKEELALTYALDVVRILYKEKKLGLNGMVLIPYVEPSAEIPDESRTPMLSWEEKKDPDTRIPTMLVWMARLKKRFHAEVQRIDRSTATLCLFYHERQEKPDRLVKAWKVGLSYGAEFGPDAGDVYAWQEMLKKFLYAESKRRISRTKGSTKK